MKHKTQQILKEQDDSKPISTTLMQLDDAGFTHKVIITGAGPASVEIADFKWVNTIIGNVKRAFHGTLLDQYPLFTDC
jgi:hypothetical protein